MDGRSLGVSNLLIIISLTVLSDFKKRNSYADVMIMMSTISLNMLKEQNRRWYTNGPRYKARNPIP